MANSRRRPSQINAGSMADIAFLLLIFFLVVSTMDTDIGINRKLPKWCPDNDCSIDIHERNLLTIELNDKDEIFVNGVILPLADLKPTIMDFVDNNGDGSCTFCKGDRRATASDNPSKAVIAVLHTRDTSYEWYIQVQDRLIESYFELRKGFLDSKFGQPLSELAEAELKLAKEAYPFQVSEAELK